MPKNKNILQSFIEGANRGFTLSFTSMIPNVLFAFALIHILNMSGLTDVISWIFGPVMGIIGLPGEAAAVLIASLLSTGGGVGAAASLMSTGVLTSSHVAILLVGIMMMGSFVQYIGRVLGTSGVNPKYYPLLMFANLVSGILAMFVTQFIV